MGSIGTWVAPFIVVPGPKRQRPRDKAESRIGDAATVATSSSFVQCGTPAGLVGPRGLVGGKMARSVGAKPLEAPDGCEGRGFRSQPNLAAALRPRPGIFKPTALRGRATSPGAQPLCRSNIGDRGSGAGSGPARQPGAKSNPGFSDKSDQHLERSGVGDTPGSTGASVTAGDPQGLACRYGLRNSPQVGATQHP